MKLIWIIMVGFAASRFFSPSAGYAFAFGLGMLTVYAATELTDGESFITGMRKALQKEPFLLLIITVLLLGIQTFQGK